MGTTPVYSISYPDGTTKVIDLPAALHDEAYSVEAALAAFGMPPVVSGTPVVAASAAARDAHWGVPSTSSARLALQNLGAETIRTDTGVTERYFANLTDGGSNPGGKATAGWYTIVVGAIDAFLQQSTAAAAATATDKIVTFDSTDLVNNLAGALTINRATGVITCVTPGTYRFDCDIEWATNTTGYRIIEVEKALAAAPTTFNHLTSSQTAPPANANNAQSFVRAVTALAAGDNIHVKGNQGSGATINILTAHVDIKKLA